MQKTVDALVRVGYAAKGIVYILIGAMALRVAAGIGGGRLTDPGGALYVVLTKPFGTQLLLVLSIGLLSYATFEIVGAAARLAAARARGLGRPRADDRARARVRHHRLQGLAARDGAARG